MCWGFCKGREPEGVRVFGEGKKKRNGGRFGVRDHVWVEEQV